MKGPQDLGGMMGFGPIRPEPHEPLFHASWEKRAMAFTVAMGASGTYTGDQSRHQREQLPPSFYWSRSYYEIWTEALTQLLKHRGMISDLELETGRALSPPKPVKNVLRQADVLPRLMKGWPYNRAANSQAQFKVGDSIITKRMSTSGHTRLPAYAWAKRGVVEAVRGCHVYPDSNGMGQGEDPHWLYTVRFTATELWGKANRDNVCLDLWEPYMDAA
jgi:nitrile hydratase subunit beta